MIPTEEPSEKMYKKEEIQMKLDKVEVIEKKLDMLTNRFEALLRGNKSQHSRIWLELENKVSKK